MEKYQETICFYVLDHDNEHESTLKPIWDTKRFVLITLVFGNFAGFMLYSSGNPTKILEKFTK